MALNEDLKKKIADKLSSRTPEQKQLAQQGSKDSAIRERVRSITTKNRQPIIATPKEPEKDLTSRIMFSDKRAKLGGDNLLGSFARLSNDIVRSVVESTVIGGARAISQLTPGGLTIPGLNISTDLSLSQDNLQKIESKVPTFSQAAIKRQAELDEKRPEKLFLNTLQAATEEIFLPLWDAVPVVGAVTRGAVTGARKIATSPAAREAMLSIGLKTSADKAITETSIRSAVQNTAKQNIKLLESGKITPEEYLAKQAEIGKAVDVINGGQTRFGRFGATLNDIANSLTQERILGKTKVELSPDGVPLLRKVDEDITKTQELLVQQNKALRGEMEEMRLSNASVLADAIKSSKLEGSITPESILDVFTIGNRQLKPGVRVSLDREVARSIVGNSPMQVQVNVTDLVRLPDGSFAYAPKALVNTGTDAISTLRKSVREEIVKREKAVQIQNKVRESLEKSKRLADEQEAARLAKEDANRIARETARKTEAEKTIKETPIVVAKRKADIDVEVAKDIAKIQSTVSVAKASLKSAVAGLKSAGKTVKIAEKKITTIKKAIAKAKKQGRATARLKQALAKANTEFVAAKKAERMAQTAAKKAKANVPTDTKVKVAELKAKADVRKAQIVEESKKAVAEARAIIKEITTANKVPSTRNIERLQAKVDKLEGKKAKLIEAYGGIDEVPADKIKALDDAIAELGEAGETAAKTTPELEEAKKYKSAEDFVKAGMYSPARDSVARNEVRKVLAEITETKKADSLRENPDNPPIDRSTVNIRAEDIREGKRPYLVVDGDMIIDGHHTYQAYLKEGVEDIPVVTKSQLEDIWKQANQAPATKTATKTTEEAATAKIKPVKIEGTDVKTSVLSERLNAGLKGMEDSPEFNVATHAKQAESAFDHIAKHGIDDTLSMIEKGSFPTGTTKASMVSTLMEAINAVTDDALKLSYTNRLAAYIPELSEFATRAGQEIEALKVLHRDNPVMKIMRIQKALNSEKKAKNVANEIAKLEKQLSKVDTKGIIKEAIDKATC